LADFRIRTHELSPPRLRCAPAEAAWYEDGGSSGVLQRAKLGAASQVRRLADRVAETQTMRCSGFGSGTRRTDFSYRLRSAPSFLSRRLAPLAVITSTMAAPTKDSKSMSHFGASGAFGLCPVEVSAAFGFFTVRLGPLLT
jgi:hypothetical protein